jgi:hypothetical protein
MYKKKMRAKLISTFHLNSIQLKVDVFIGFTLDPV